MVALLSHRNDSPKETIDLELLYSMRLTVTKDQGSWILLMDKLDTPSNWSSLFKYAVYSNIPFKVTNNK